MKQSTTLSGRVSRPRSRRRAWLPGVAGLTMSLILTACGSTALQGTTVASGTDGYVLNEDGELVAVDPVTGEVLDGGLGGDGLSSDGLGTVDGLGGSGSSGVAGTSSSAPGAPGTPGAPVPSSEPGTGPLLVGVVTANVEAIYAAFGVSGGEAPPSFEDLFAKYVNARGGVAGREVKIVKYEAQSSDNASTAAQQACATFTQDNKVDIVVNPIGGSDILAACLKAAGVAMIDAAVVAQDRTIASQFPNWVIPSAMIGDRIAAGQLQQALSAGILKSGDNLGVLIEDCPAQRRIRDSVVKPAAAKAGVKVTEGAFRCVQNLVQGVADVSNDVQREVLRFATEGVTHVLIVSNTEAFAFSRFTTNAEQQNYFPKYLVSSQAYPWNNSRDDSVIKIADSALPNIYGMGISPLFDIGSEKPVNEAQASVRKFCETIDPSRYGANDVDANDRPFRLVLFYAGCDAWRAFQTILESNGGRTAYPDVAAGFRAMLAKGGGSAFLASGVYSAGAADRTDGATTLRPFRYDAKSKQWIYTGGPVTIP